MEFDSHLDKKLLSPGLLDFMLNIEGQHRNDYSTSLKVRQSFEVPTSWKSLSYILQHIEESN